MASKGRFVKLPSRDFHKIIDTLKSSKSSIKIKGKSLRQFLISRSDFTITRTAIPAAVKVAILKTKGLPGSTPLGDKVKMANFKFSAVNYIRLTQRFNDIALKHKPNGKKIGTTVVQNCLLVKDCIDLVVKTAS